MGSARISSTSDQSMNSVIRLASRWPKALLMSGWPRRWVRMVGTSNTQTSTSSSQRGPTEIDSGNATESAPIATIARTAGHRGSGGFVEGPGVFRGVCMGPDRGMDSLGGYR